MNWKKTTTMSISKTVGFGVPKTLKKANVSSKTIVYCSFWSDGDGIIGPTSLKMKQAPALDLDLNMLWFQQDGATYHTS
jgi:hypothetical protein